MRPTTATTTARRATRRPSGERSQSAIPRWPAPPGSARGPGPYDYSPDWNPIIGEAPGIAGLHLALAWSGHGFKLSPAVGEVVAAEVVGAEPRIDVTALRPTRFAEGALLRLAYGPGARA